MSEKIKQFEIRRFHGNVRFCSVRFEWEWDALAFYSELYLISKLNHLSGLFVTSHDYEQLTCIIYTSGHF